SPDKCVHQCLRQRSVLSLPIADVSARMLRYVEQDAHGCERRHQRRATVRDERQRNPFRRHQRKHDTNIKERLSHDAGNNSQAQQHSKSVGREQSSANTAPEKKRKHGDDGQRANESEFLTNDRENKIGVSEWKKQHLLLALCEAETLDSARSDRNQRLHNLKTCTLLVCPRIEKRDQTFQSP